MLIPGLNDDRGRLSDLAAFIAGELGPETPWHISRFYPQYKMADRPPTSPGLIAEARHIGLDKGLNYVYSGNLPGDEGENSFCASCGEILIERSGYRIDAIRVKNGKCPGQNFLLMALTCRDFSGPCFFFKKQAYLIIADLPWTYH